MIQRINGKKQQLSINCREPDVAVMYGVSGYPTKYVIDPEGKIAKQVVGENPEFYMYLDALMK